MHADADMFARRRLNRSCTYQRIQWRGRKFYSIFICCLYLGEGLVHALNVIGLDGECVVRMEGAAALHDRANLIAEGHQPAQDMHTHLQAKLQDQTNRRSRRSKAVSCGTLPSWLTCGMHDVFGQM